MGARRALWPRKKLNPGRPSGMISPFAKSSRAGATKSARGALARRKAISNSGSRSVKGLRFGERVSRRASPSLRSALKETVALDHDAVIQGEVTQFLAHRAAGQIVKARHIGLEVRQGQ